MSSLYTPMVYVIYYVIIGNQVIDVTHEYLGEYGVTLPMRVIASEITLQSTDKRLNWWLVLHGIVKWNIYLFDIEDDGICLLQ